MDSNSTQLAAIVADTAEIQAELADGGRTDLLIDSIKTATDHLATAMELDGAVYRFTANALEEAPSGTGGDATAANQTTIINHLTGIKGATFDTSTDSLEAIRNRGDAAWVTGSGLSGSNTALITVQDGSGNNIVGATVDIYDSGNTTFQQRFITNSSGQVTFTINDGAWYIRIIMQGYSFTAASFTVSGDYTHTFDMTPYTIGTPASADLCRITYYVKYPTGATFATLSPTVTVDSYNENNVGYFGTRPGVYTSASNLVYWDVVQGAACTLKIPEIGKEWTILEVPEIVTAELEDLI